MIFITGPLYSGKRTFAQTLPGKRLSDVQVLAADAADLPALADKLAHEYDILIATEVGGGVVPMDVKQRADREAAGRLACLLAARGRVRGADVLRHPHGFERRIVPMLIYLLRHGQTEYNAQKRYQGQRDIPLSPEGAARLRRADFDPDVVYVSTLQRTSQTARILFPEAKLVPVDGLKEMCFGSFEGRNFIEMEKDPVSGMGEGQLRKSLPGWRAQDGFFRPHLPHRGRADR